MVVPLSKLADSVKDARFLWGVLRKKPLQVLLQVTNRCNMTCGFCDFWTNPAKPQDELSTGDYRRIARELGELSTCLISIEGGEPFLRKDLDDIVAAFGERHLPMLFTNGSAVTPERARGLFDRGLAHACVSIDFASAARHDEKRGLPGASARAWSAIEHFRTAAPVPDRQVHVMTVIMEDNVDELEDLFARSHAYGVGHQVTLLSNTGFRRGKSDRAPKAAALRALPALWRKYPHVRFFREYFEHLGTFVEDPEALPRCDAGAQSFNIDHVGNLSVCIEKIDQPVGNVREASIGELAARAKAKGAEGCQACWTACRGLTYSLGNRGTRQGLVDLATRLRRS